MKKLLVTALILLLGICLFAACDSAQSGTSNESPATVTAVDLGTDTVDTTEQIKEPTEGLNYDLAEDKNSYIVEDIGSATDTDILIPSVYRELPVTGIGDRAFSGCRTLTSITIPDSVTSIGEDAFFGCEALTSVTMGNGVTSISEDAFGSCSNLANITMGNNVTSIGVRAFSNCYALTSLTIPNSVTNIGEDAFNSCTGLTNIIIPDSITIIGDYVFEYCGLTSITIPESVTGISGYAFFYCNELTSITFNGTVEKWNAIVKGGHWDKNTGEYTIHCTDGEIKKDGTVTMY